MAEAKIPVIIRGEVLGTSERKTDDGKVQLIARVLVPVPGDMPEMVDVRNWPADAPIKPNQQVAFSAIIRAWQMNGRNGVSVRFVSFFAEPKPEKAS